ncbi:MAG: phosphoethanolamine transferase [Rickettsiales bacterium]|jgi:glucan phosphoethanolaminetransferase (alkaline phosphatase superfamily)|nr:phosphoethanolamine transferase [Rickettsiales bacterium]
MTKSGKNGRLLKNNFLMSLCITALVLAPDFCLRLAGISKVGIDIVGFLFVYVVMLSASFMPKKVFWAILALTFFMDSVELHYMAYFGFPMNAFDISNVFKEAHEILETGLTVARYVWFILPIMLAAYYAAIKVWGRFENRRRQGLVIPMIPLVWALGYTPYRTFKKPADSFYPGTVYHSLHNAVNAFSWWAFQSNTTVGIKWKPYRVEYAEKPDRPQTIVLAVGESINRNRLGIYGYGRDTTPKLAEFLSENKGASVIKKGYSTAPATRDSLPLLFNQIAEPCNIDQLQSGDTNILKLAHDAGYATWVISAQENNLFDRITMKWADRIVLKETSATAGFKGRDDIIFDTISKIDFTKGRNFIVFFTRSIHSPYSHSYDDRPEFRVWDEAAPTRMEATGNAYDNAVLYYDDMMARIFAKLRERAPSLAIAFTSDHGEMLGEDGFYGHLLLEPRMFEVPYIYYSTGFSKPPKGEYISHAEMVRHLSSLMGYRITDENMRLGEFYLSSGNIYQECRFIRGRKDASGISLSEPLGPETLEK